MKDKTQKRKRRRKRKGSIRRKKRRKRKKILTFTSSALWREVTSRSLKPYSSLINLYPGIKDLLSPAIRFF